VPRCLTTGAGAQLCPRAHPRGRPSPPGAPRHTGMPVSAARELVACRLGRSSPSAPPPVRAPQGFCTVGAGGRGIYARVYKPRQQYPRVCPCGPYIPDYLNSRGAMWTHQTARTRLPGARNRDPGRARRAQLCPRTGAHIFRTSILRHAGVMRDGPILCDGIFSAGVFTASTIFSHEYI
jgi:hypothetical protein